MLQTLRGFSSQRITNFVLGAGCRGTQYQQRIIIIIIIRYDLNIALISNGDRLTMDISDIIIIRT